MKRPLTIALLLAGAVAAAQQRPAVTARVEPDSIGIGDRFDLVIEVDKDLVQVVEFPLFAPEEEGGIELYENLPVDTLAREGRRLKLRKRYRMAAFDEGRYDLGAAQVLYIDKNIVDTLASEEPLRLEVGTFRFAEIRTYVLWGLLAALLLGGALYALVRFLVRRGRGKGLFGSEPQLPPHVAAIKALEALNHRKLWQNNRHKQYYSELTDILRTYIAARWEVGAMEMTSDEIVAAMREVELPEKARRDLVAVLRDADLAKFAKAMPDAEQNESDYLKCYYFVEETKAAEAPGGETNREAAPETDH